MNSPKKKLNNEQVDYCDSFTSLVAYSLLELSAKKRIRTKPKEFNHFYFAKEPAHFRNKAIRELYLSDWPRGYKSSPRLLKTQITD